MPRHSGSCTGKVTPPVAFLPHSVPAHDAVFAWELLGKRALRQGDWKIVWESRFVDWWNSDAIGVRRGTWQLYNLS